LAPIIVDLSLLLSPFSLITRETVIIETAAARVSSALAIRPAIERLFSL